MKKRTCKTKAAYTCPCGDKSFKPSACFFDAMVRAPMRAPSPEQTSENPECEGLHEKYLFAKNRHKDTVGLPIKLTRAVRNSAILMGTELKAPINPSFMPGKIRFFPFFAVNFHEEKCNYNSNKTYAVNKKTYAFSCSSYNQSAIVGLPVWPY
jgi:hypothetical protein